MQKRGPLYFLPDNVSFAAIPGLEREMRRQITIDMVRRIAEAGADGRMLAVNTTNLDEGTSRVFDLVTEAQRAVKSKELERFTASCSPRPACLAFPVPDHRRELYVDGGVTGNILYGGRGDEEDACRPCGSGPIQTCRSPRSASGSFSTTSFARCRR